MQVEHLKRQLKNKDTLALHSTSRNKFMETQRRNILVNELRRINDESVKVLYHIMIDVLMTLEERFIKATIKCNIIIIIFFIFNNIYRI